jgi:excisionase family DNA binding protein
MALQSIRQVAKKTGLSYTTIWSWVKAGKIQAVKVGGSVVRIPDIEVDKLMQRYETGNGKIIEQNTEVLPENSQKTPENPIEII